MKLQTKITIVPSRALGLYCLESLVGRTGVVVENRYDSEGVYKGSWVKIDGAPYEENRNGIYRVTQFPPYEIFYHS